MLLGSFIPYFDIMPKTLEYFREISRYPRPSKQEEKIRNFLISWATSNSYPHKTDKIGNLIVYVDARNTNSQETVILQSHMDMVCVKTPESNHDFLSEGIQIYEDQGFLRARNTSLWADNGIGMALSMAACEFESHPRLELVFTMDEEAGMTGVENLDYSLLSGKKVINLDSEDEDEICISSAGGIGIMALKRLDFLSQEKKIEKYKLSISGMQGGHSGCEIHQNRWNAIHVALEFVSRYPGITAIYDIKWGYACNVIPSESEVIIWVVNVHDCKAQLELYREEVKRLHDCPGLSFEITECSDDLVPIANGNEVAKDILQVKSGIYAISTAIPDLVETSMNLWIISVDNGILHLTYLARSSVNADLSKVFNETKSYFHEKWYEVENDRGYLGWQGNPNSTLVEIAKGEIRKVLGRDPKVVAVHAGLECGAMVSGLGSWVNAISIGPNVSNVHSVEEKIETASIERTEKILEWILAKL